MKYFTYLTIGTLFGIIMTKSQAISWYRIYEMFRFDAFHMYGIIGSAVLLGVISVAIIKKFNIKTTAGTPITFKPKNMSIPRYLFGGTIFGLGWAMTGACPGPIYTLIGNGYSVILVVLFSAILGTLTYGMLRNKLPH
ncbi:YeeE/YedE thiosulfate transporter family protein [Pontibacter brevis]